MSVNFYIRPLMEYDIPVLLYMLENEVSTEATYPMRVNKDSTRAYLWHIMGTPFLFCHVAVDINTNTIIGFALADSYTPFFSSQRIAREVILYIKPKYRNFRVFKELIKNMEIWAKSINSLFLELEITYGYKSVKIQKIYERIGYTFQGPKMIKMGAEL